MKKFLISSAVMLIAIIACNKNNNIDNIEVNSKLKFDESILDKIAKIGEIHNAALMDLAADNKFPNLSKEEISIRIKNYLKEKYSIQTNLSA